jgi:uncharacterized membrane protein YhaH (DUF805 family)
MDAGRDPEPTLTWLLLSPRGRIGRRTWWIWSVVAMLGLGLYLTVLLRVAGLSAQGAETAVDMLLLWPVVALSIKRWHDRDKSGWWVLVVLLPLIGWLWAGIENGLRRGSEGANRYGPPTQ